MMIEKELERVFALSLEYLNIKKRMDYQDT